MFASEGAGGKREKYRQVSSVLWKNYCSNEEWSRYFFDRFLLRSKNKKSGKQEKENAVIF